MPILNERVTQQVRERFADLRGPVRLVFFERSIGCETCPEARRLAEEVAALSDQVTFEAFNVVTDRDAARSYRVAEAPVLAVVGARDHGIRFYGTPTGYEFGSLIDAILDVGSGEPRLEPSTVEALEALTEPVHLRVFVTPG